MSEGLEPFEGTRYLNLETYRENGEGVRTPLWFVNDGGALYARTHSSTGKVRRIANGSRVRVVPSDRLGSPIGEWLAGEARVVGGAEAKRANRMLNRRYGLLKRYVDITFAFGKGEPVVLAIRRFTNP